MLCPGCGRRLAAFCLACGARNRTDADRCVACDAGLAELGAAAGAAGPLGGGAGERRYLTLMSFDLVDSTPIAARLDVEEYEALLDEYRAAARRVIESASGICGPFAGDGALAWFGYPVAREGDAARAVRAGRELVDTVRSLPRAPRLPGGTPLAIRVGIHSGLVLIGTPDSPTGEAAAIASRVREVTEPNSVLVSAATRTRIGREFQFEAATARRLRGLPRALVVSPVSGEHRQTDVERLARIGDRGVFVGREQELTTLFRTVLGRPGAPHALAVFGEAGIGKSRLIAVALGELERRGVSTLVARCAPADARSPYLPIADLLRSGFDRDLPETAVGRLPDQLSSFLEERGIDDARAASGLLCRMAGIHVADPERDVPDRDDLRARAFEQWLAARAHEAPQLVVIEDVQWADSSTEALLEALVGRLPAETTLILSGRNGAPLLEHVSRRAGTLLLAPLARPDVEAIVHATGPAAETLPVALTREIVGLSGGLPLFAEELARAAWERRSEGMEDVGGPGRAPTAGIRLPGTLHEAILIRLDRLPPELGRVVRLAAVIGGDFDDDLLADVGERDPARIAEALANLERRGVVVATPDGRARYAFHSRLVRDVAYETLTRATRRDIHSRVADALIARFPAVVETRAELVAHHLTEADRAEPAIRFWRRASRRAATSSSFREAADHLRAALECATQLVDREVRDELEFQLRLQLIDALSYSRGHASPEVGAELDRLADAPSAVSGPQRSVSLLRRVIHLQAIGSMTEALACAREAVALATEERVGPTRVIAEHLLGATHFWMGAHASAADAFATARAEYDALGATPSLPPDLDPIVALLSLQSVSLEIRGHGGEADRFASLAMTAAAERGHRYHEALAAVTLAMRAEMRGDHRACGDLASDALRVAERWALPYWASWAAILRGWSLVAGGSLDDGLAAMQTALTAYRASNARQALTYFLALYARAARLAGLAAEASSATDEGLALADRGGERFYEAELWTLRGELLADDAGECTAAARSSFRTAARLAEEQGAIVFAQHARERHAVVCARWTEER